MNLVAEQLRAISAKALELPIDALAEVIGEAERLKATLYARMLTAKMSGDTNGADHQKPYLNTQQAAAYLGVPVSWIRDRKHSGTLPYSKPGRYPLFKREDLDRIFEEGRRK